MNFNKIIFDLDGTLVDSAPSILRSLNVAFNDTGINPTRPLSNDLIGPSLDKIFEITVAEQDKLKIPELMNKFKNCYDEVECCKVNPYAGVCSMLKTLSIAGVLLYVVTNKRLNPTQRILKELGWSDLFLGVYTLDTITPSHKNKSEALVMFLKKLKVNRKEILYIGDREDDRIAAKNCKINFLLASWGYGVNLEAKTSANSPSDVLEYVGIKI